MQLHCRCQPNLSEHAKPWVDVTVDEVKAFVYRNAYFCSELNHHILLVD